MKNIFKENKELKEKNNVLNIQLNEAYKDNSEQIARLREAYDSNMNKRIEFMEFKYRTKIERKKQVEKIVKLLELRLKDKIKIFDEDLTEDIDNYLKLLEFLKKE